MQFKTIFVISDYGKIDLLTIEKKSRYSIELSDLKSLTWVSSNSYDSQVIVINSKANNDYRVECFSQLEKESIFKTMKYLHWKVYGKNLPIYAMTKAENDLYFNGKRVPKYQRIVIPEKYRVTSEDIYFEKIEKAKMSSADGGQTNTNQIDSSSKQKEGLKNNQVNFGSKT